MTVEIQKNKDNNTCIQSMITIRKQYRQVPKKVSIDRKSRNKMRRFHDQDECYLEKYLPSKYTVVRERDIRTLLLQVITLNLKEDSCIWYKGHGYNCMSRIETLLCHITGRSIIMDLRMELMSQTILGTYSRINIQLSGKIRLGQDAILYLTFINIIRRKK